MLAGLCRALMGDALDDPEPSAPRQARAAGQTCEAKVEAGCSSVAAIRAVIITPNWTSAVLRMTWSSTTYSHAWSAQRVVIAAPMSARHGCIMA